MKHLKLFFALFAMLALGVGNAWGAETLYKNALFKIANCTKSSSYTGTVTCTIGDDSWVAQNAANNNGGWDYVKIGAKKSKASDPTKVTTGTITTNAAYAEAVSKIVVNGKKDRGSFTSKLIIASNSSFTTDKVEITGATSFTNNQIVFEIASPSANKYYKLEFVCSNTTTSNGVIQVSSVEYYYEPSSEETVVSVPTFSVPECTFYSSSLDIDLSCATDGATIHYTIDGTTPSKTSPTYSGAIAINNTTTIKAIAVKDGLTNSEVATATYTKGETVTSYDIDFETNALEAYVNWDFSNITVAKTITAKGGTYYGNTSGKASASIKTKEKIQYPGILTFSVSKESTNTTASNWLVQVSENGTTWSTVGTISATEMTKGTWNDHSVDLSDYENVYVQISYGSSTATRAIDEISLAQGVAPVKYTLTIGSLENGTLSVTKGGVSVASGDQFKAGTSLVVTPAPATGYVFESLTVDGSAVELTDGTYTFNMPAADVTISATFKANEKPVATLTLSKNFVEEPFPGSWKQDDVVTLPDFESDCSKTFVGWSENQNCNTEPEYKAGDSYQLKLEGNQTLYAVYADGESGEVVTQTLTITDQTTNSTYGNNSFTDNKGGVWSGQSNIPDATHFGLRQNDDNTHMASPVFPNNIINITAKIRNQSRSERKVYLCSNNTTAKPSSGDLGGVNVNGSVTDIEHTFTLNGTFNQFYIYTNGALQFNEITVTYASAPTYSNYSTKCAAALEKPTFSVDEGTYTEEKSIKLNATEGDIYYTLDGTDPTKLSTLYTDDAIVLDECGTTTIKAIAISTESQSPVASATYTINLPITNTAATAYTPTEAIAIIDGACDKTEEVFVKGVVVSTSEFNATYGNYDVIVKAVDDNSATPTTFTFYRMYKAESNTKFTESDEVIGVGDIITAKGVLKKFNSTYELAEGCYMVEREAFTEPKTDISNTLETAYTVDKAFELISDVKSDLDKEVYVKGLVAVASTQLYEEKYLTYSISDNGQTTGNALKVYDGLNIGGVAFTSKDDVKVGDYVVVKGKLLNYGGTYEINKDNQLVQHKKAATITIADITMEVGETQAISATVTPEGASISYEIKADSDNCITLNNASAEITATAAGTATIIATIAETTDYLGVAKEFTVTVTTPDTRKKAVSPSPFTEVSGNMNPNDITYSSSKGGGTSDPAIKDDKYIQLYQIASGKSYGGFITFNAVKGCKIDQVKIVTGNKTTTHIAYSVDDVMSATTENVQKNAEYITEAGLNAESVNIYCMHTDKDNRLFIASAIVYYTGQPLADPELSWTSNAVELQVGEEFTAPKLNNPNNVTGITYDSDNESLAMVNETTGAVTLVPDATGTATITAKYDGNETYKAANVSYTITVKSLPVSGVWVLITDVNSLAAGDKVVIVAKEWDYALSTTQNDNNRGQAAVTKNSDDNTVAFGKDVQVLTLEAGTVDNTFALNTGKGYLYAASSGSNYLRTETTLSNNSSWAIAVSADGTATIVAKGSNTRNTMQYNQTSSVFACYGSASQKALCIYKKNHVKVGGYLNSDQIKNSSDVTVLENGTLTVNNDIEIENLYIKTTMGTTTSGQISGATLHNLTINGDAFIDITLGDNANPQKWHAFTVPFPVDAMNGVYDLNDNQLKNEVNYAIMDYHGDIRANGQYGWKKYRGILVPGTFYLMTVDGERTTYRFKKVKDAAIVAPATKAITAYDGTGDDMDKGWNGVGNPTLMYGKVAVDAQILDPETYTYKTITASSAHFTVGTPFFIQAAEDGEVTINAEGNSSLAPARRATTAVEKIKVMLGNADYTDHLYVSASEDATNEYEIGKDLVKMVMTNTPIVPQIFAEAYGARLCMVNAPMTSNEATVALNLYAPAEGEYTLSVEEQADATVYLLFNGNIVWNLSMSEYPIQLSQGDNAGYSLVVRRENAPTDVENILGADEQTEKFIYNGKLYILHEDKVFNTVGNMLK